MSRLRQFSFSATSISSSAYPLLAASGTPTAPSYSFSGNTSDGIYQVSAGDISISLSGGRCFAFQNSFLYILTDGATISMGAALDCNIARDAANVGAMKNGATAQEWRTYGSTTSAKYASMSHNGTISIFKDTGGSGTRIGATGANVGFYGTAPVALQTGTAATATAVRQVLINLGLCS